MNIKFDSDTFRVALSPALVLSTLTILLGLLALAGWIFDIDFIRKFIASSEPMKPVVAIGFMLLGLDTLQLNVKHKVSFISRSGQLATIIVIIACALKLYDIMLGTSFHIDEQIFFSKLALESPHPLRMSVGSAFCLFVLGLANLFLRQHSDITIRIAQGLTVIPIIIALSTLIGYSYGIERIYELTYTPMAFNSVCAALLLSTSVLCSHPHEGFMRIFTSSDTTKNITAVLLPAIIIIPFVTGWITLQVRHNGSITDTLFCHALSAILNILMLFFLYYFGLRKQFFSELRMQAEIEQRKTLEDELRKSEAKFHALYEQNDDAVMLLNKEGFFDCNKATLALFGCATRELFYTQHPADLSPKQQPCKTPSLILANQHITKAIETGCHRFEWLHKRIDNGATFLAEVMLNAIGIGIDNIIQATVRDITERKKEEKIINESVNYYRSLIEASLDPFVTISQHGAITDVNLATEQVTGIHRDQLIGTEFSTYFTDPELAKQGYLQVFSEGLVIDFPLAIRHLSGRITDVLYNASVYRDNSDNIMGVFAAARDITKQKQMQQRLQEKERMLSESQSIAHVGSWSVDLATHSVCLSDEMYKIFGVTPDTFGHTLEDFISLLHPDDRDSMIKSIDNCIHHQQPHKMDFRILLPDGSVRNIHGDGDLHCDELNEPVRIAGSGQDITERAQASELLRQSEIKHRTLFDTTNDAVLLWDKQGFLLDCNPSALTLFGLETKDELLLKRPFDLSPAEQSDGTSSIIATNMITDILKNKGSHRFEWLHQRLDNGQTFPADVQLSTMKLNGKQVIQATVRDITERKKAEGDIRLTATIFESQQGMMITDANKIVLRINRAFTVITGYSAEDVIGKEIVGFLRSGRHTGDFYTAQQQRLDNTGYWDGEIWHRRKNGEHYPEYLTITAVKDREGQITNFVSTFEDITLRKAVADQIERLAFYDSLTNLPNRRLLQDRLQPALASSYRSGRKGALLFIDLDKFKILNDTLGHDMGDLLLQQVAERLVSTVRENDTVARLGGDEFVLMLQDLSDDALKAAAQTKVLGTKILAALNQPYQLASHVYHSTPSIGATVFNGHDYSIEEIMKQADIAMYQAKDSGRNTLCFFDAQMQASINANAAMEAELRLALTGNQFELYYQPQVNHNQQIMGAEALIRWHHPQHGMVSPAEFIPLAEESGLIVSIGQWVLETACAQLKAWGASEHTKHLQLAVNVSARQFHLSDFVELVSRVLSRNAFNHDRLKLELTETMVLDNVEDTFFKMMELKNMGVEFSMDDFGTGHSSLSILKKLPFDQLKIDQSFVRDISIDNDDEVIVKTIIQLATNLGMEIIAEGVETEVQRDFLEQNNCLSYQGYLFSKPVPIEQFELLLKRN